MRALVITIFVGALVSRQAHAQEPAQRSARQRVVAAAEAYLEEGKPFADCSSFVRAVFERAEVPVHMKALKARSNSEVFFRSAKRTKRPEAGDIAVFHNTYDRNGDSQWNDLFSHIAVVEKVDGSKVTLIHRGSEGVARISMNLRRPSSRDDNSVLRAAKAPSRRKLTGQLFAGFGALVPSEHAKPVLLARGSASKKR